MNIEESLEKWTFEDWKNKKVVLIFERRDFDMKKNIPVATYDNFIENSIQEIKQQKEIIFLSEQHRIYKRVLCQYENRKNTTVKNLFQFNHQELAEIDNYLFGKVPHIKVDKGGVYSLFNQKQAQIFTKEHCRNNFEGIEFDFVSIDYSQFDFCFEAFVCALWQLRVKIKEEMQVKFERNDLVFTNWEAHYLFLCVENELEQVKALKKADYDFLFYQMKEIGAIKTSTSQFEFVLFLSLHSPNLGFDIPDFKKRIINERREGIFNKIFENSSYKRSIDRGFTIYCSL